MNTKKSNVKNTSKGLEWDWVFFCVGVVLILSLTLIAWLSHFGILLEGRESSITEFIVGASSVIFLYFFYVSIKKRLKQKS